MDLRGWRVVPALSVLLMAGCATGGASTASQAPSARYGLDKAEAVEACRPQGQQQYLARLVCPTGEHPPFKRNGNVGPRSDFPKDMTQAMGVQLMEDSLAMKPLAPGAVDYHYIDEYAVTCESGTVKVYMDMYHCDGPLPQVAPAGFKIVR